MRLMLSLIVLVFLLFAAPASAGLITFGEVPVGTVVSSEYVGDGVYFWQWTTTSVTANWNSGNIVQPALAVYGPGNLGLQFVQPGNSSAQGWVDSGSINFDIWDTNAGSTNVYFYDENGVLIPALTILGLGSSNPVNISVAAGYNVGWIYFQDDGDGHVIDNIAFGEVMSIPEPATFALLGAGLLAVGLLRRRK